MDITTDITTDTTTGTTDIAAQYAELATRLQRVLDDVEAFDAPSPCEGWSAADVVAHLVDTQRDFLTERGLTVPERPDVAADPAAAWRDHASFVGALLADPGVADRSYDGFFGPATIGDTLLRFYGFDMIVHRWDVGRAAGRDVPFSDAELTTVEASIAGFGEHLYDEGICRAGVEAAPGADRTTRMLAALGRVA